MDKPERAKLLRQRFKAKGGLPFVLKGERKPTPEPKPKVTRLVIGWPQVNRDARRAGIWIHKPDPIPRVVPKPKRNAGVLSVVTRIAQKAPNKLRKRYANADVLLVSRVRRSPHPNGLITIR